MRVQDTGSGVRELTLLSGVAGEIPAGQAIRQLTIRNHPGTVSSSASGSVVVRWLEGPAGAPCSQYAVVAAGLTAAELDAVLSGIR